MLIQEATGTSILCQMQSVNHRYMASFVCNEKLLWFRASVKASVFVFYSLEFQAGGANRQRHICTYCMYRETSVKVFILLLCTESSV